MENNSKIDVIFRKEKSGDFKGVITAYFPHEVETSRGEIMCYSHIGQHSCCDYQYCVKKSVLATKEEYSDLYNELKSLGYELNVIKKQNYVKYLTSLFKISKIKKDGTAHTGIQN